MFLICCIEMSFFFERAKVTGFSTEKANSEINHLLYIGKLKEKVVPFSGEEDIFNSP